MILGLPGLVGQKGDYGPRGPQGLSGLPGPQGVPGPVGPRGLPGPRGEKGFPGAVGFPGNPGKDGQRGLPGFSGDKGVITKSILLSSIQAFCSAQVKKENKVYLLLAHPDQRVTSDLLDERENVEKLVDVVLMDNKACQGTQEKREILVNQGNRYLFSS